MSDENTAKLTSVLDRLADNQIEDAKRIAAHEANYIHLADVVEKMGNAQTNAMVDLSKNVNKMATNIQLMSSDNERVREKLEVMDETFKTRISDARDEFTGAVHRINETQEEHSKQISEIKLAQAHYEGVDEGLGKVKSWVAANWFKIGTFATVIVSIVYTVTVFIERLPKVQQPATVINKTIDKAIIMPSGVVEHEHIKPSEPAVEEP